MKEIDAIAYWCVVQNSSDDYSVMSEKDVEKKGLWGRVCFRSSEYDCIGWIQVQLGGNPL